MREKQPAFDVGELLRIETDLTKGAVTKNNGVLQVVRSEKRYVPSVGNTRRLYCRRISGVVGFCCNDEGLFEFDEHSIIGRACIRISPDKIEEMQPTSVGSVLKYRKDLKL